MKSYQNEINELITNTKEGYWSPFVLLNCITEELGELTTEILHKENIKKKFKSQQII